ncbi:MAG TPA: hypothetical protein VFR17_01340 [Mycobacterium sp.]|nr:hypothetical protein [Mycobacterium sp.]
MALVAVAATVELTLSATTATATPESDAQVAILGAWEAAGAEGSPLGVPDGDVYPIGSGFAQNYSGGKIFFTPDSGAHPMYGAILDKYESWGGPADSDLGFPNGDEVPGKVSPDSRDVTFSAPDNPVIFWTPEHGAHVVRGAINAAWDKLGGSGGVLGVPVDDESQNGALITQKFSGGQLSWNAKTQVFTSQPPDLAAQLSDLKVQPDPTVAMNRAWHAAGGAKGPLGVKQGDQFPIGNGGVGQQYAGGKIFFSPATGAAAVEGDILAKYESLGGPVGSDLGFPVTNEADGAIPGSRITPFAADDEPVIFYTKDNGAFVVRGAMKVAWDKLGGGAGKLGPPIGDQSVEGDVISQKFKSGKISWNRVANRFSTQPSELAKSLSGLQIPGLSGPNAGSSTATTNAHRAWHWWWLLVAIGVLGVIGALWSALSFWRRRPQGGRGRPAARVRTAPAPEYEAPDEDLDEQWSPIRGGSETAVRVPSRYSESLSSPSSGSDLPGGSGSAAGWASYVGAETDDFEEPGESEEPDYLDDYEDREPSHEDYEDYAADSDREDDTDTAPTRIPSAVDFGAGRHAATDASAGLAPPVEPSWRVASSHPAMHLPLDDPYEPPEGYPVKANVGSGLYYTTDSALYDDTLAELWFADEDAAQRNGFVKAR